MIFGTSQLELTESMLEYPHPHVTQGLAMGFEPGECDGPLVQVNDAYVPFVANEGLDATVPSNI